MFIEYVSLAFCRSSDSFAYIGYVFGRAHWQAVASGTACHIAFSGGNPGSCIVMDAAAGNIS